MMEDGGDGDYKQYKTAQMEYTPIIQEKILFIVNQKSCAVEDLISEEGISSLAE